MPTKHTFNVRRAAGAESHSISIQVPTFDEATEKQRRAMYARALFNASSATVTVQNTLRRSLENGLRGEQLLAKAQTGFTNVLNEQPTSAGASAPTPVVDQRKFTPEQVAYLVSIGCLTAPLPEAEDEDDLTDEQINQMSEEELAAYYEKLALLNS